MLRICTVETGVVVGTGRNRGGGVAKLGVVGKAIVCDPGGRGNLDESR